MSKPGSKPYKWVQTPEGHLQTTKRGLMQEHRLVAEQIVGRLLTKYEVVHHIDENTLNNDVDNLMIFAAARDHNAFHMGAPTWSDDGLVWHASKITRGKRCAYCGKIYIAPNISKQYRNKYCSVECANKGNHIAISKITQEQAENLPQILRDCNGNFSKAARLLGITDNAIRKRLKQRGLSTSSKDYKN